MTVKRWSVGVDGPDENGNLVAYADYLSLAAENSSLRLTIDNIVNALKLGDGPVSQQVIELVNGLVAENVALTRPVRDQYDWSNAVWRDCDQCGKQHTGTVTEEDGSQICAHCADQIYWSAWQALAEQAIGQLEAAQARIAELESKQEPVAIVELSDYITAGEIINDTPRRKAVRELYDGALVVGQNLYTTPPKPVVKMPALSVVDDRLSKMLFNRNEVVHLLKDSGLIVEGE